MFHPPVTPLSNSVSSESDLKNKCVVLYEVLYGAASSVVLPVGLEQRGTEHYGQIMEVHLVHLWKTLHAETHAGKTHMGINRHARDTRGFQCVCVCFSHQ